MKILLALVLVALINPCFAQQQINGGIIKDATIASKKLQGSVDGLGAAGDGSDDSAYFTSAFGLYNVVDTAGGKTYGAKNLVLPSGVQLNCHGSTLKAVSGANYVIQVNGLETQLVNCRISDNSGAGYYTLHSTTLSAIANAGDTSITVTSATGLAANMPIFITLDCGMDFPTVIAASYVSGTSIPLLDPIPNCATALTVVSGGAGYANANTVIEIGGEGAPFTGNVTNTSGGVIQAAGISLMSPGFQTSVPGNPVSLQKGSGTGATVNVTWAGAASGKAVRAAFGVLLIDKGKYVTARNLRILAAPVGIQVLDTGTGSGVSFHTVKTNLLDINEDSITLAGIVLDTKVSQTVFNNVQVNATQFGVVGVYQECYTPGSIPCGGNYYTNMSVLGFETGMVGQSLQLNHFIGITFDTSKYYGGVYFNSSKLAFGGTSQFSFTTFDGTNGGTGVAVTLAGTGSDIAFTGENLRTHACGMWIGSSMSTVFVSQETLQTNTYLCGPNDYNQRDEYLGGYSLSSSLHAEPGVLNGDRAFVNGLASGSGVTIGVETPGTNSPLFLASAGNDCVKVKPGNTSILVQHCPNYSLYTSRIDFTGNTPGSLTTCGTSPSITGNNKAGRITIGTGGATACTFTFDTSPGWAGQPVCYADNSTTGVALGTKAPAGNTTTKLEIDGTMNTADVVTYLCIGIQ